ncbi:MAG: DUF3231 family protein [Bacillota bacterium]
MSTDKIKLTSAEIATLWSAYMNDTMAHCILEYFFVHAKDREIRPLVGYARTLTKTHIEKITHIFNDEGLVIPNGFNIEKDVNLNAPRLYTDEFMLTFLDLMSKSGLIAYGGFISMSSRKDIRTYFIERLHETTKLFDACTDAALLKGLYIKAPYIEYPIRNDFVDNKSYFYGFSFFNKERSLNAIEISYLFMNINTNVLGTKIALSFAQTSPREDVQKWMLRGSDISKKHIEIFSKKLLDNNIQSPMSSDVSITNETTPPFSDKLALFLMTFLSASGVGNYSTAAAASQRSDLVFNYERLSLEIGQYAKDGANIMIKNKWLEEPPGTIDKEKLSKSKDPE